MRVQREMIHIRTFDSLQATNIFEPALYETHELECLYEGKNIGPLFVGTSRTISHDPFLVPYNSVSNLAQNAWSMSNSW